jgi:hypothetical protein
MKKSSFSAQNVKRTFCEILAFCQSRSTPLSLERGPN